RFVSLLNACRVLRNVEREEQRVPLNDLLRRADITWHGVKLGEPDWSSSSHSIALTAKALAPGTPHHMILNAYWEPLEFELPPFPDARPPWRRWIDPSLDSPQAIVAGERAPVVPGHSYRVGPRSVVVLFSGL